MNKNIELEFRANLSEEGYLKIRNFLDEKAFNKKDDSKRTFFYIWSDRFGKVVYNDATKTAKLSMKLSRIGQKDSFEEIEFHLNYEDKEMGQKLLESFNPMSIKNVYQFRNNYVYKDVSLALKYTNTWGFHLELEKMISDDSEKDEAEKKIRSVADEFGCKIMTNEELKVYTEKIDGGHKFGKYSEEDFPYK